MREQLKLTLEIKIFIKPRLSHACDKAGKAEAIRKASHADHQAYSDAVECELDHVYVRSGEGISPTKRTDFASLLARNLGNIIIFVY